jgi:Haem-degrading
LFSHDSSLEPFGTLTRCDVETGRHLLEEGRLQVTSIPSRQFVGAFAPPRGSYQWLRTAELFPLVQPGQELFPLMGLSEGRFCSMGGGAPLTSEGQMVAGVGVSGGTVEQDVNILESALQEAVAPALAATS